ncbi:MAG TPA: HD-GYP domain-containing protein [Candidatus Limiplasma sp.]|nr:HD-GYP domain-containing protein [Candidatus Limiplasma sp.]HRX08248.1 HD-GYP domain-containing protein [Candidatus Limiplasma sp.]
MTKGAKAYLGFITLCGLALLGYAGYRYFMSLDMTNLALEIQQMICLIVLCICCGSLPIVISRKQQGLDITIISILAAVIVKGTYAAMVVYFISSVFTVRKVQNKHQHILNTPLHKTAFNTANQMIAIFVPGVLLFGDGGFAGELLPNVILPSALYTAAAFLLSSSVIMVLFIITKRMKLSDASSTIKGILPNVLFAMPLGVLMAWLFDMEGGHWIAMVMLFPLLLARYAWSLYIESQTQHMRLIEAFVSSMEAKDHYTEGHSRRVGALAVQIARQLRFSSAKIKQIEIAALLHDIGKIGIEETILQKPNRLNLEEQKRIQAHPLIGVETVQRVGISDEITEMIRHHHERYEGGGYPDGLDHTKVSFEAYILGVADAFDAMTSDRPYRTAMSTHVAMTILEKESGKQFHPEVVRAMKDYLYAQETPRVHRSQETTA